MRKFRRITGIALCAAMLVTALTGCMNLDATLEFHEDGSWTCTEKVAISEDMVSYLGSLEEARGTLTREVIDGETYYSQEAVINGANTSSFGVYNENSGVLNNFIVKTWVDENNNERIELSFLVPSGTDMAESLDTELGAAEADGSLRDDLVDDSEYTQTEMDYQDLVSGIKYTVTIKIPYEMDVVEGDPRLLTLGGDEITIDIMPEEPLEEDETYTFTGILSYGVELEDTDSHFPAIRDYTAGKFTDVSTGAWYADEAVKAYESGFISGTSDTTFSPSSNITIAELMVMAARLRSTYFDEEIDFTPVDGDEWYTPYMRYLINEGVVYDGEYSNPGATTAQRLDMASIFARVLPNSAYYVGLVDEQREIPDMSNDTSEYYIVLKLYNCGIVGGVDEAGTFKPYNNLTRAEAAVILTRLAYSSTR